MQGTNAEAEVASEKRNSFNVTAVMMNEIEDHTRRIAVASDNRHAFVLLLFLIVKQMFAIATTLACLTL